MLEDMAARYSELMKATVAGVEVNYWLHLFGGYALYKGFNWLYDKRGWFEDKSKAAIHSVLACACLKEVADYLILWKNQPLREALTDITLSVFPAIVSYCYSMHMEEWKKGEDERIIKNKESVDQIVEMYRRAELEREKEKELKDRIEVAYIRRKMREIHWDEIKDFYEKDDFDTDWKDLY